MAKVLIVDDHPTNRQFLVTLLTYAGHLLREASNGQEALLMAAEEHFHLVITDLDMPVVDGPDLARQLRANPRTTDIPIIFYTATYSWSEATAFAKAAGVPYVLQKPVEPEVVLKTVAEALG